MFSASSTVRSISRDINSECHITARSTATLRERRFAPSLVRVIADVEPRQSPRDGRIIVPLIPGGSYVHSA